MAGRRNREDYPVVKYRVVNGNGYAIRDTWEEVLDLVERYRTDPAFKDDERFQVRYVIKITEEYIEI